LIALAKAGRFENETLVFLHTGGAQGLFGYQGEFEASLQAGGTATITSASA